MNHAFAGKWITNSEFSELAPRDVFHRQLNPLPLPCHEHRNRHILFRKRFHCEASGSNATLYISADDYYKVYINGNFVAQGPTPSYHFHYNYNTIPVGEYLHEGENTIAVHTLYQGLINRVWQSGDNRHGLILDLCMDDEILVSSDESFKTAVHSAYMEMGICGYDTQFLERYDSTAAEVGFEKADFNDADWQNAARCRYSDHTLVEQTSSMLEFETIFPMKTAAQDGKILYDFGANYVGYLVVCARGKKGETMTVKCGQELQDDGSIRSRLRANCNYEEEWILSDGESRLDWFDYKSFRFAELSLPDDVKIEKIYINARHYPFSLHARLKPKFSGNETLRNIWNLCVHTQKYGVQEVIQDCMEREKGFYLGDGCYTALTNMILTDNDSMVRRLIDDAFLSDYITDSLVTCINCSFMQEIAEYPLILVYLVLWHYRLTGDKAYLESNYPKVVKLLDAYRRDYEKNLLLQDLDKWCVVEWPQNFRHGYDVDIEEGKVCREPHVSINAYYIEAVRTANQIAATLELPAYRDEKPLFSAFYDAFYDKEKHLFKDAVHTKHISLVGNSFVYGFGLCPAEEFKENFWAMLKEKGIHSLSLFCTFPVMMGHIREKRDDLLKEALLSEETWSRMLREGATTTFEGWGKETKWNTSLFHLTLSYAALFMSNTDLEKIFNGN